MTWRVAVKLQCIGIALASCSLLTGQTTADDPRIPAEVRHKTGYINPVSPLKIFESALLWGIAIADTRASDFRNAEVSVAWTQLSCLVAGKTVILNDDWGNVRGGLYRRFPWFGTDEHEPMPTLHSSNPAIPLKTFTTLRVGQHPDRVWHFWSASPRARLPHGNRAGCTVKALVKISPGALLQIGMDYWRNATTPYGSGGNNHEAGVSNWYFPSAAWQEVMFSDIPPVATDAPRFRPCANSLLGNICPDCLE
ncbi:MAG: hypothetical protein M3O09_02110 [Acidobacteriota bacterium]|nr:hypothetical protein [Acidobacteriota bacterium]